MKILSVLASPNREGNTAGLLKEYLKGVGESYRDIQITELFLQKEDIKPCMGCNWCKKEASRTCVIEDDMQKHYEEIIQSDVIILATPVYWFGMTAQLKTFIDRIYGMDYESVFRGKKVVILSTFYAQNKIASGAVNISNEIKSICSFLGMEMVHDYGVSSSGDEEATSIALNKAYQLGKILK